MTKLLWTGLTLAVASVVVFTGATRALAASDVVVGGQHERLMQAAQRDLVGGAIDSGVSIGNSGIRISVADGQSSAVTGFTPRFAGLGVGQSEGDAVDYGSLLKTSLDGGPETGTPRAVRIGPEDVSEIAGFDVGWSAIAGVQDTAVPADGAPSFMLGGELAIEGLRFDATFGQQPAFLGLEGHAVSAGLGYDFGWFDTHVTYSLVSPALSTEEAARLWSVGSQVMLRPWLVVNGDVAMADDEEGVRSTAGRVSLRLNF